ncbi:MAG: hypothetical protein ACREGL_11010 [Alphaproteobacteria bacterium]
MAAIDTVIRILTDPAARPNDRLRAANMVLERAYGRPRSQASIEAAASVVAAFIASLGDHFASALAGPPPDRASPAEASSAKAGGYGPQGGERQSASREQPAAATERIAADGAHGVTQESTGSTPHEPPEAHSLGAP